MRIFLVFMTLLYPILTLHDPILFLGSLQREWKTSILINFSIIIATGNQLSNGWICHRQPIPTALPPQFQPTVFNLNLILLSASPKDFKKGQSFFFFFFVNLLPVPGGFPCTNLTPVIRQTSN